MNIIGSILCSVVSGIISIILSYRDVYFSNIYNAIHGQCIYLDSFVIGFLVTLLCLRYLNRVFWSMVIGIVWGCVISEYTTLLPLCEYTKILPLWIS